MLYFSTDCLADFPEQGRLVPETIGNTIELRELLPKNYRIVYQVKDDQVQVVMVLRGNRLFVDPFNRPTDL
jgi:plasmid stabilization system protein ParE